MKKENFSFNPLSQKSKCRFKLKNLSLQKKDKRNVKLIFPMSFKGNYGKYLRHVSHQVLSEHSADPEKMGQMQIEFLLADRNSHFNSVYKDSKIYYLNKEFLKGFYPTSNSVDKLSKYYHYYKNYLNFFCRPFIRDFATNKIMLKHMEKAAEIFYNNNYKKTEQKKVKKIDFLLFTKNVVNDIEKEQLTKSKSQIDVSNITTIPSSVPNEKKKNNSIDQSLNNSINIILSVMNRRPKKVEEKKKEEPRKASIRAQLKKDSIETITTFEEKKNADEAQLNKKSNLQIKHPLKLSQKMSPGILIINSYSNFQFHKGENSKEKMPTGSFSKFKLNANSLKSIFSKDSTRMNFQSKIGIKNSSYFTKNPISLVTTNFRRSNSNYIGNANQNNKLSLLSSPTVQKKYSQNLSGDSSNGYKVKKHYSNRARKTSKKSCEESTRASNELIIPKITIGAKSPTMRTKRIIKFKK